MPPLPVFTRLLRRLLGSERWQRLHVRAAGWAVVVVVVVMLAGSWLIVPVERSAPRANITSFPLALWWSVETASTVGYGDLYPVTFGGRVIATVLLFVGIALFSVVTAAVATWFVGDAARRAKRLTGDVESAERAARSEVADELRALHAHFERLERTVTAAKGEGRPGGGGASG
ncbi:potassium channel family protein [Streptomyces sp. NPDC004134]|uniref:potassium channel family protein n=1 Tax=Streptomyces sp. NPDC004134 TaxID=3364691 RepID=UPI0036CA27D0